MLQSILESSFDTIHEIEGYPTVDILRYIMSNNPSIISDPMNIDPYQVLQEGLRCVYSDGVKEGEPDDDTTRSDLTLFVKENEITFRPNFKLIFRFESRLYKLTDKDPNHIFGLLEFNLTRAD